MQTVFKTQDNSSAHNWYVILEDGTEMLMDDWFALNAEPEVVEE